MTSEGVRPDDETRTHIESCPAWREYVDSLAAFTDEAGAMTSAALTVEEAEKMVVGIKREIAAAAQESVDRDGFRIWQWAIRPAAAAALILLVGLMPGSRMSTTQNADQQLQVMSMTEAEKTDALPLLLNGDIDQVSRLLDQTSAAYITDQVRPSQVEDILDNTSTEELEYMLTTLSAEI